jgi:hypothetical protein
MIWTIENPIGQIAGLNGNYPVRPVTDVISFMDTYRDNPI